LFSAIRHGKSSIMRLCFNVIHLIGLCLMLPLSGQAHQVPNMTIEADFSKPGSYELKINVDPRVFLSNQPTTLPPVEAAWYLKQSPAEREATYKLATEHLEKHLKLLFSSLAAPLPKPSWQAMDGATSGEVTAETTETHLLATVKAHLPAGAENFALSFAPEAQVSLILLLKSSLETEPKVMVIFPGESSRPFAFLAVKPAAETAK